MTPISQPQRMLNSYLQRCVVEHPVWGHIMATFVQRRVGFGERRADTQSGRKERERERQCVCVCVCVGRTYAFFSRPVLRLLSVICTGRACEWVKSVCHQENKVWRMDQAVRVHRGEMGRGHTHLASFCILSGCVWSGGGCTCECLLNIRRMFPGHKKQRDGHKRNNKAKQCQRASQYKEKRTSMYLMSIFFRPIWAARAACDRMGTITRFWIQQNETTTHHDAVRESEPWSSCAGREGRRVNITCRQSDHALGRRGGAQQRRTDKATAHNR